ncbi:MAG TPA: hypothetical protein VKN18_14970 [Blastocatellia bacterium]|nr:hypothetical protein [Blastocatellia bacterium]
MKLVNLSLRDGDYFATVDGGPEFFVGKRVTFQGMKGLVNTRGVAADRYDRALFNTGADGLWADFIFPTSVAEGGLFHTLNTYDRARFTFGFLQYAAHVPNGDFVRYFRDLLKLPAATDYFPDLIVQNDRIFRIKDNVLVQIENDSSTAGLMDFLNPSSAEVEDTEVIQSAKVIHWVKNDPAHRKLQVDFGKTFFREAMVLYDRTYNLNGVRIDACLVVADIRHQGRGGNSEIRLALQNSNPVGALLTIGASRFPERVKTVKRELNRLMQKPEFASKTYSSATKEFV